MGVKCKLRNCALWSDGSCMSTLNVACNSVPGIFLTSPLMNDVDRKAYKRGIAEALNIIKHLQRYDLEWEWMSASKEGSYIKICEAKKALIERLCEE